MRRMRFASVLCFTFVVLALIAPAAALAEEAAGFPSGRYDGSAMANSKPQSLVSVKIWLTEKADGTVGITISTPRVPLPFSAADATPKAVPGGYDLPLSVAYGSGKMGINGSGLLQLRQRGDSWLLWGTGSGTALGKSGSGRGSAGRATQSVSTGDSVVGSLEDFFGGGSAVETIEQPTEYPEAEFAEAPSEVAAAPVDDGGNYDAPSDAREILIICVMMLLMLVFGLVKFA